MSEDKTSNEGQVKGKKTPSRTEPKQISFRVSEDEYLKLKQSAETLNMSVPNFVKKKAQGSRLIALKLDRETRQSVTRQLVGIGNNVNQLAKYCNAHKDSSVDFVSLNIQLDRVRKELNKVWEQLS